MAMSPGAKVEERGTARGESGEEAVAVVWTRPGEMPRAPSAPGQEPGPMRVGRPTRSRKEVMGGPQDEASRGGPEKPCYSD